MLANGSVENAQGLHGLQPQTNMEKISTEPTRSKERTLRRKARGASNKSQHEKRLVRETADNAGSPPVIEIWCQIHREDTTISKRSPYATPGDQHCMDRLPRWTNGKPAKYIEAKPRCLNCTSGTVWPWETIYSARLEDPVYRHGRTSYLGTETCLHGYEITHSVRLPLGSLYPDSASNKQSQAKGDSDHARSHRFCC